MEVRRIGPDGGFIREFTDFRDRIKSLETAPAGNIVIRETLTTEDPATGVKTTLGQLPDGSFGIQPFIGDTEPPPIATVPIVAEEPGLFTVSWDGLFVGNDDKPRDFEHVNVLAHKVVAGVTVFSIPVGVIRLALDTVIVSTDVAAIGETWQFSLESEDYNGNTATPGGKCSLVTMRSVVTDEGVNEALQAIQEDADAAATAAQTAQNAAQAAQTDADAAAASALAAANLAESKGVIYTQTAAPAPDPSGLWIDTAHNNVPRRYLGVRSALVVNAGGGASIQGRLSAKGWAVSAVSSLPPFDEAVKYDLVAMDAGFAGLGGTHATYANNLHQRGISLYTSGNDTTALAPLFTGGTNRGTPKNSIQGTTNSLGLTYTSYSDADLNFYLTGVNSAAVVTGTTLVTSLGTDQPINIVMEHATNFSRWVHIQTYATPAAVIDLHLDWLSTNWVAIQDQGVISAASAAASAQNKADQAFNNAATAATAAGTAQTTADAKNRNWYTTTAPTGTGHKDGDQWFDTDDGNKLYLWKGTPTNQWVSFQDAAISAASQAATGAQATADGKNTSYYLPSAPTGTFRAGDMWFDTANGYRLSTWSGSAWQTTQDAYLAQQTADAKGRTYTQATTPPVAARLPQNLWVDISLGADQAVTKYWEPTANAGAGAWIPVADKGIKTAQATADAKGETIYSTSEPAVAQRLPQNLWIDTTGGLNIHKRWATNQWVIVADSRIAAASVAVTAADAKAQTAWDSALAKATVYTQDMVPPVEARLPQNLWNDTSLGLDKVVTKYWSTTTSQWVALADKAATEARTVADAKGETIYGTSEPSVAQRLPQNTWVDTNGGLNINKRWDGNAWIVVVDARIPSTAAAVTAADAKAVAAQGSADAKATVYTQSTVPPVEARLPQNLWNDTSLGLDKVVVKYWSTVTSQWVALADKAATEARTVADAKGETIYSDTEPTVAQRLAQNTWVDTAGGLNITKRWNGLAWIVAVDARIPSTAIAVTAADAKAVTAQTTADAKGRTFTQSIEPPTDARLAQNLWVDTSLGLTNAITKYWNTTTSQWTAVVEKAATDAAALAATKGKVLYQTSAPTGVDANLQTLWIDTTGGANTPKRWISGTTWNVVTDKVATDAAALAATKGKVIIQSAAPDVADRLVQNLWIDTTAGVNLPKRWNTSGSTWDIVTDKTATDAAAAASAAQSTANTAVTNAATADSKAVTAQSAAATASSAAGAAQTTANTAVTNAATADSKAAQALADALAASNLAATKGKVLYQSTAPTGVDANTQTLWIDTTSNLNTPKKWVSGTTWTAVTDKVATDAAALAATKGKILYQTSAPTGADANDLTLWIDTTGGANTPKKWVSGTTWISLTDKVASDAAALAATKGKILFQTTAPTGADASLLTLWIDTTGGANTPKKWVSGTTWAAITDKVALDAATAAANAATAAQTAQNDADDALANAQTAQDRADQAYNQAVTAATAAGTAQTSADGKSTVWYQDNAPAGTTHRDGDLWFDTNDGNKPYIWRGTPTLAWLTARDATIATAQSKADTAFTTASGKTTTYYQPGQPSGGTYIIGDMWVDTDGGYKLATYNGSIWQTTQDALAAKAEAIAAASTDASTKATAAQTAAEAAAAADATSKANAAEADAIAAAALDATTKATAAQDAALLAAARLNSFSGNASFEDWTAALPAGFTAFTTGPTKELTTIRSGKQSARFNVTASGNQAGLSFSGGTIAGHLPNLEYFTVELDFYLESGTLAGAGVILDWAGMTNNRATFNLATEVPVVNLGKWYKVTKVLRRPTNATGTWTQMSGFLMANWTTFGAATKNIIFDWFDIRPSTTEEITAFGAPASIALKSAVFYEAAKPTGGTYKKGDVWFDTANGNRPNVHNGTDFVLTQDQAIFAVQPAVTTAITNAANGKNKVVYSTSDASGTGYIAGDTWFKKDGSGTILAQWEFTTSWQARTLNESVIGNLSAGKIATGTLAAGRIGANTISADKIFVGDLTNLAADGNFTDVTKANWTGSGVVTTLANQPNMLVVTTAASGNNDQANKNTIQVTPGEQIYAEAYVYGEPTNVGNGGPNIHLTVTLNDGSMQWPTFDSKTRSAVSGAWTLLKGSVTVPANAKSAKIELAVSYSADAVGNVYSFRTVVARRMATGNLIVDGAITATSAIIANGAIGNAQIADLHADKITAGTIAAARLDAETIKSKLVEASYLVATDIFAPNSITSASGIFGTMDASVLNAGTVAADRLDANTIRAKVISAPNIDAIDIIATNSITSASGVFGDVSADVLTSGTIGVGRLDAETIKTKLIEASLIDAVDILASNSITAASGIIGSLDASKITTGTVSAAFIGAKSLGADKILISSTDNLINESDFRGNGASWELPANFAINQTAGRRSLPAMVITNTATLQTSYNAVGIPTKVPIEFPSDAGNSYRITAWVKSTVSVPVSGAYVSARFTLSTGGPTTISMPYTTPGTSTPATMPTAGTWYEISGMITAPTNAISVAFSINSAASLATGTLTWDMVSVTRAAGGDLIVDGAIDGKLITGATIQTEIAANRGIKLTSAELAGYDGAGVKNFSLTAAGVLTLKGDITTGSTITGARLTGAGIETSATPLRGVKISSSGINTYDSVGTLTFKVDATTGVVEAPGILANSIKGDKIQAGSVSADRLLISDFTNLLDDPSIFGPGWIKGANPASSSIVADANEKTNVWRFNALGQQVDVTNTNVIPVKSTDRFLLDVRTYSTMNASGYLRVLYFNEAMTLLSPVVDLTIPGSTPTWTPRQMELFPPAAARFMKIQPIIGATATTGYILYGSMTLRRRFGGELIVDGAINGQTITGATITGGLIQSEVTASRGIKLTSTELAGYDGAGVKNFSLESDGDLYLRGIIKTGSTIEGATVTGTSGVQTNAGATTGVKMTNTGIIAYDAGGNMSFKVDAATGIIEAPGLKANTITGDMVAAKAISVDKLTVQDFSNYVENPGFETGDLTGWDVIGNWTVNTATPHSGTYKALVAYNGAVQSITNKAEVTLPVGGKVRVKFRIYSEIPSVSGVQASVALYNTVGGTLESVTNITQAGQWIEIDRELTATTAGSKRLQISTSGAGAGGYLRVDSIVMNRMMNGELIVDGAIDGKSITGATITGGLIQSEATVDRGIKMTSAELAGYDSAGVKNFSLEADGDLFLRGIIKSGSTIEGVTVTGTSGVQTSTGLTSGVKMTNTGIIAYNGAGNMSFKVDATTGEVQAPGLKANTITGDMIASQTIRANNILIGDFNNLATIDEVNGVTVTSFGPTQIVAGYNKLINDAGSFLMFTDQRGPVPYKAGDVLYYEFTAKATSATTVVFGQWNYDLLGGNSTNVTSALNVGTTDTPITGQLTVTNIIANAKQFVVGLQSVANKGIQVKGVKVYKKYGGNLIVDGALDAKTITGATIQTDNTPVGTGASRGIKLLPTELIGYDGAGNKNFSLTTAGALTVLGEIKAGSTIQGARIVGTAGLETSLSALTGVKITNGGILAYDAGNNLTFKVDATTGEVEAPGIKANSIKGDKIATDTLTARNIAIGDFTNVAYGGEFNDASDLLNWTITGTGVTYSTTTPQSGAGCLAVAPSGSQRTVLLNTMVAVRPGDQFTGEYWYKTTSDFNGTAGNSKVRFGDHNGALLYASSFNTVNTSWTKMPLDYTIPASGVTDLQITLNFDNNVGSVWIDNVILRKKVGTTLIENNAITTGKIAVGGIDAGAITAGTISAIQMKSKSITVDKLLISATDNLIQEAEFAGAGVSWQIASDTPTNAGFTIGATAGRNSLPAMLIANTATTQTSFNAVGVPTKAVIENQSDTDNAYRVSGWLKSTVSVPVSGALIVARFRSTTGTFTEVNMPYNTVSNGIVTPATMPTANQWYEISGIVKAPPNTISVAFGIRTATTLASGTTTWDMVSATRASNGELVVDGSIKTQHLSAGNIDAGVLTAGSIKATQIGTKAITTDKLTVTSTDNLIVEADFGNAGSSWEIAPAKPFITINATAGRGTLPAMRVTGTVATQTSNNLVNRISVGSEDRFRGSMWIKSSAALVSGTINLKAKAFTTASTSTPITIATNPLLVAGQWTNISGISPLLPTNTIALEFYIEVTNNATGTTTDIDYVGLTRAADGHLVVDGAIDGKLITGAQIRTAATGARVTLDGSGLRAYDLNDVEYLTADSTGLNIIGTIEAKGLTDDPTPLPMTAYLGNLAIPGSSWNDAGLHFIRDNEVLGSGSYMPPSLQSHDGTSISLLSGRAIMYDGQSDVTLNGGDVQVSGTSDINVYAGDNLFLGASLETMVNGDYLYLGSNNGGTVMESNTTVDISSIGAMTINDVDYTTGAPKLPMIVLAKGTNQSLTSANTWYAINWDAADTYNYQMTHSHTTNSHIITIQKAGIYEINYKVAVNVTTGHVSGSVAINGTWNGSWVQRVGNNSGQFEKATLTQMGQFNVGDTIQIGVASGYAGAIADPVNNCSIRMIVPT